MFEKDLQTHLTYLGRHPLCDMSFYQGPKGSALDFSEIGIFLVREMSELEDKVVLHEEVGGCFSAYLSADTRKSGSSASAASLLITAVEKSDDVVWLVERERPDLIAELG